MTNLLSHLFMSEKYRPSNGTEGMMFESKYCHRCVNEKWMHSQNPKDKQCPIFNSAFFFDIDDPKYPEEMQYNEEGNGICTAFKFFKWEKDENGNWIDPPPPPDPNQLNLFE